VAGGNPSPARRARWRTLNGDGRDEILTGEDIAEDVQIRGVYRVYSYVGNQYRLVWEFESLLPTNDLTFAGDSVPMVVFAAWTTMPRRGPGCEAATAGSSAALD